MIEEIYCSSFTTFLMRMTIRILLNCFEPLFPNLKIGLKLAHIHLIFLQLSKTLYVKALNDMADTEQMIKIKFFPHNTIITIV